jgi:hypothetical protein
MKGGDGRVDGKANAAEYSTHLPRWSCHRCLSAFVLWALGSGGLVGAVGVTSPRALAAQHWPLQHSIGCRYVDASRRLSMFERKVLRDEPIS